MKGPHKKGQSFLCGPFLCAFHLINRITFVYNIKCNKWKNVHEIQKERVENMAGEVIYSSDGKLIDGIIVKYYEEGKKMSETPYVNGMINGTEIEYFYDGTISAKNEYVDNELEGISYVYYPSGALMEVNPYKAGKLNGTRSIYYETGVLHEQAEYQNDELHGKFTRYSPEGIEEETIFYRKGLQVEVHPEELEKQEKEEKEKPEVKLLSDDDMDKLL